MRIEFNNIRAEGARNRLTIEQFCRELGVEKKTFYNWEAKGDLPASYAVETAKLFNTSVDYILGYQRTVQERA